MMTSIPRAIRWVASFAGWALMVGLLIYPQRLPTPARAGLESAVNGAARVWLWIWDEPADALDNPAAEWSAAPAHATRAVPTPDSLAHRSAKDPDGPHGLALAM